LILDVFEKQEQLRQSYSFPQVTYPGIQESMEYGLLNSVASAFPVACCGVSERMTNDYSLKIEASPQLAAESFNIIQKDFPVVEEPFKAVAAKAGISEDEVRSFACNRILKVA